MGGERRKRKLEDEESEEEEKTMEKFFALIRSTKDIRGRLRSGSDVVTHKGKEEKKVENEKVKGIWNPTFQPEDFMDDMKLCMSHSHGHPTQDIGAGPSKVEDEAAIAAEEGAAKNQEYGNGLDLNLSL